MMMLILLVTICFVLESEATLPTGLLAATDALVVFENIEFVSVIIFSVEYVVRVLCCPIDKKSGIISSVRKFLLAPFNIVDALACIPFWVTYVMQILDPSSSQAGFGFIRAIRLVRVFRVFKIGKYSIGIQMFG